MTSQINPNNINGNYPKAGVSNSTQGMRDNFNNTKTNFQYAANEISALQTNGVFKAALPGTTLDNNMNDSLIYAVKLNDISYSYLPLTATSGDIDVDYSAAPFQQISLTGPISLSFSNWPTAGSAGTVRVGFNITNTAYTVTLPPAVSQGVANLQGISPGTPGVSNTITFGAVGNYAFEFVTIDGGTTVWVFDDSRPTDKFSGNITVAGNVVANAFYGDGSTLSNIFANYVFNGNSYIGIGASGGNANISVGGTSNVVVVTNSTVQVNGTGGIALTDGGTMGYAAGAGGTVSQSGNKSGGVTLNKPSGEITMQNTALNAATVVSFVLTNSTISSHDVMVINHVSGGTIGAYTFTASCNNGNATIYVRNNTAGSLSEALVLRYAVIKGSIT